MANVRTSCASLTLEIGDCVGMPKIHGSRNCGARTGKEQQHQQQQQIIIITIILTTMKQLASKQSHICLFKSL